MYVIYQELSDFYSGRQISFSATEHTFSDRVEADDYTERLNSVPQFPIGDFATYSRYRVVEKEASDGVSTDISK